MTSQAAPAQEVRPVESLTTELVAGYISDLIASGQLGRGHRLPAERELVGLLHVSRTSVRAGLQLLAAKGVLVIRHGAGTFVADGPPMLDCEPLKYLATLHGFSRGEMFESRRVLEVRIAGLAAERATSADYAAMSEEVASMFAVLDDPQAFLRHDIRFHRAVGAACGNRILASLVEMVSAIFYESRRQTADRGRDRRRSADMHRKIYQAIRSGDRSSAERLMQDHLLHAEHNQNAEFPVTADEPAAEGPPPGLPDMPNNKRTLTRRRARARQEQL